jgi:hypothetical protein
MPPPPPSCAGATEVGFMFFRPRSHCRHLPRMQQRDGVGLCDLSTPFTPPPPPSYETGVGLFRFCSRCHLPRMQERNGGGFLVRFDPAHAASTSVLCLFDPVRAAATFPRMQQPDGGMFASPPPSHAETVVVSMAFRPRLHCCHFPRIEQRAGCGLLWPFDPVHTAATPRMQQGI